MRCTALPFYTEDCIKKQHRTPQYRSKYNVKRTQKKESITCLVKCLDEIHARVTN